MRSRGMTVVLAVALGSACQAYDRDEYARWRAHTMGAPDVDARPASADSAARADRDDPRDVAPPEPSPDAAPRPDAASAPDVATTSDLLANGSFERTGAWLAPWRFTVNPATTATVVQDSAQPADGAYSARVAVTQGSTMHWYVVLYQPVTVQAGRTYSVRYFARASAPQRFNAVLQQDADPYAVYGAAYADVGTAWREFGFEVTAPATSPAYVGFNLANTTGQVWLDRVSFTPR